MKGNNASSSKGFTLIEVLVAMVILTLSIAVALNAYQVALEGSRKAAERLSVEKLIPAVRTHVTKALRDKVEVTASQQIEGQTYLGAVDVLWSATKSQSAPPPPKLDPDMGGSINYGDRYYLYEVVVRLEKGKKVVTFNFNEVAWGKSLETEQ